MAFDPSVIREIGTSAQVDPAAIQGKALTLADLYRKDQLGKMDVAAAKSEQADMSYAKEILQGKDLSKREDQDAAVSEITKRNPKLGMELMKQFLGAAAGKMDLDRAQLELYNAKNDIIGGAVVGLKEQHDTLARQGKNEAEINAAMMPQVIQTVQGLVQGKLPDGKPVLNDQDRQWIQENLAKGYNPQAVDTLVQRSTQAKQALASKLAERKVDLEERKVKNTESNTESMITDREGKARDRAAGKMAPEDLTFTAAQYLAGDKSVLSGIGRGTQGATNLVNLRREIRQQAEEQGLGAAGVAAKIAEFNGVMAEERSLGTRLANIRTAATEAKKMIPIAKAASDAVPRGAFKPWSQLVKGFDVVTQDPDYAKFAAATLAVVNTWARAISPSGTPTVADKEHAHSVLSTVNSQEAYNAVLDQFQTEIDAALESPGEVRSKIREEIMDNNPPPRDRRSPAPVAAAPGTPPPTGAPPAGAGGAPPGGAPPPPPPGFQVVKPGG